MHFRARPDSVQPGRLQGPFDGQVLDAGSGKPLEGATVVASWALRAGRGPSGPGGAKVVTVDTDADGRYRFDRFREPQFAVAAALDRFTLVVYKRGYVGWRSDLRFADGSPRTDFTQLGNVVALERLPIDVSHRRHLAYLGADGPLLAKLSWELPLAARELSPSAESAPLPVEPPAPVTHLDARALLSADELKAVSGSSLDFTVEPLPDLPSTPGYDSVHFKATGRAEKFDAALRVWKLGGEAASRKFDELARELPGAEERRDRKDVGDRSLRSSEGDIVAVGALDRSRGVVVLFTCGRGLCEGHDQAAALLRRMWPRLGKMGQVSAEAPPPAVGGEPQP